MPGSTSTCVCVLPGLQQTYTALKEHSGRVEAAMAARESSVMELSSHADSELLRQAHELHTLTDRLSQIESLREEEQQAAARLKSQVCTQTCTEHLPGTALLIIYICV